MPDHPSTPQAAATRLVERTYVPLAAGAGIIPVPLVDIAAVIGVQLKMLAEVSDLYGKPFAESRAKLLVSALLGGVTSRALAASLLKALPGLGSVVGGISLSVAAGGTTYAVGHVFIRHFENGGTLLNFEPGKMKTLFREQFERGKTYAQRVTARLGKPTPEAPPYKVYCIIKPKLGKGGKVYLKAYIDGKRPEKYIGSILQLQQRYGVEDLAEVKSRIITDFLPEFQMHINKRYAKTSPSPQS
jgi:uncharacterized protein (DUF697 family)